MCRLALLTLLKLIPSTSSWIMAFGLRSIQKAVLCRRLPARENSRICSGIRAGHSTNSGGANRTRLPRPLFPETFEDHLKRDFTLPQNGEQISDSGEARTTRRAESLDERCCWLW